MPDAGDEILEVPNFELQRPENAHSLQRARPQVVSSIHTTLGDYREDQDPPPTSRVASPHRSTWFENATTVLWRRMADMQGISDLEPGAKRVPTFYATIKINTVRGLHHTLVISCVGVGFGAIHCAGWNFVFRTPRDKVIWQVSSAIITIFPFVAIFYVLLVYRFVKRMWGRKISRGITYRAVKSGVFVWYIFVRCLPIYLIARVILLLEALIALRDLPDGAFAQVEWSTFVPHI